MMDPGFEGIGDFSSDDPYQRYIAHQAAKGNYPAARREPDIVGYAVTHPKIYAALCAVEDSARSMAKVELFGDESSVMVEAFNDLQVALARLDQERHKYSEALRDG